MSTDSVAKRLRSRVQTRSIHNEEKVERIRTGFRLLSAMIQEFMVDAGHNLCREHSPRVWARAHTAEGFANIIQEPNIRQNARPVLEVGCVCSDMALHQDELQQTFQINIRFCVAPDTEEPHLISMSFSAADIRRLLRALAEGKACGSSKEVSPSVHNVEIWVCPRTLMLVLQVSTTHAPAVSILIKEIVLFQEFT